MPLRAAVDSAFVVGMHAAQVHDGNAVVPSTCAIRTDDTLACWISYSQSHSLLELRDQTFKAIAASENHTCAIRTDGTLACWEGLSREVNAPSGTFQDVSVGFWRHFCAIRSDGVVVCWGNDRWGQSTPP